MCVEGPNWPTTIELFVAINFKSYDPNLSMVAQV